VLSFPVLQLRGDEYPGNKPHPYEDRIKYEQTDFRRNKDNNEVISNIGKSHYIYCIWMQCGTADP